VNLDKDPHSRSLRALEWGTLAKIFELSGSVAWATSRQLGLNVASAWRVSGMRGVRIGPSAV